MRSATVAVYLALAAVAAIATAAAESGGSGNEPLGIVVDGSFSFVNSPKGLPVSTAMNIGPGGSAKGTVEISNEGGKAIAVILAQRNPPDVPSTSGGVLSQHLMLKIRDLSSPTPVYEGPLAAMQSHALGRLAPGGSRSYEFTVTLPANGTASASDKAFQGASASIAYSWTASEDADGIVKPSP